MNPVGWKRKKEAWFLWNDLQKTNQKSVKRPIAKSGVHVHDQETDLHCSFDGKPANLVE
jgi:hypothetical protein